MGEANPYPAFRRRCIRNMAVGTALSILPAGAFYFFVFPYSARQLAVLAVLGAVDLLLFFPADVVVLQWTLRDAERAFRPGASESERQAGLKALLDAPRNVIFPRIYGFHALAASAGITLLVVGANAWFGLGIPAHTFPLYWVLNLTVVPAAHVVYEFARMEQAVQPLAGELLRGSEATVESARPFTLEDRMAIFFPIFVAGPVAIVLMTVYIHAREHWGVMGEEAGHLLHDLLWIGLICIGLFLYLMYQLGGQLRKQTGALVSALDRIGEGEFEARAELYTTDEFGQIAGHVNKMASGLAERERLRDLFGAYMTDEVAAALLAKGEHAERTEKRYVAILFLDVRGFTAFSNERPAEVVVGVLNKLLEQAVEAIAGQHGTVNKYLGDGLLAVFGAPMTLANPCAAAVSAALDVTKRVRGLNHLFAATGVPAMKIGIGIHAGEVVVGSIGSTKHKLEYTVIGDAVNVASRIEQLNKTLGTELLVSDEVWSRCGSLQEIFGVALSEPVKGIEKPVKVYPLMAGEGAGLVSPAEAGAGGSSAS